MFGWSTEPQHQRIAKWVGWQDISDEEMLRSGHSLWKDENGNLQPHCRNYNLLGEAAYLLVCLRNKGFNVSLWMNPRNDDWVVTLVKRGKINIETNDKCIATAIQAAVLALLGDETKNWCEVEGVAP